MKLKESKIVKIFTKRKAWLRQISVASLAAAFAWFLGDKFVTDGGLVAAIICSLSIRISMHKSVREGFGQTIGTIIGAGVALTTVAFFDFGSIAIGTTVLFCAIVARALRLGEVASVNVPVTALIVIGPGLSQSTATHRLWSTVIGAGVAIVFSYFSHAKTPAGRTLDQISTLGRKVANLFTRISQGLDQGLNQTNASQWLAEARLLVAEIPKLKAQALEARAYARWSPLEEVDEAEDLYLKAVALEHIVAQIRTIARTLFDLSVNKSISKLSQHEISAALFIAAKCMRRKIETIKTDDIFSATHEIADELRRSAQNLANALIENIKAEQQEDLVRSISIVSNLEIVADSIDESSPALRDVLTPDEALENKVLQVPVRQQSKNWGERVWRLVRIFLRR
jgi:uncharacterized membrane protein YgaE (UPF0421/DUF939 family)